MLEGYYRIETRRPAPPPVAAGGAMGEGATVEAAGAPPPAPAPQVPGGTDTFLRNARILVPTEALTGYLAFAGAARGTRPAPSSNPAPKDHKPADAPGGTMPNPSTTPGAESNSPSSPGPAGTRATSTTATTAQPDKPEGAASNNNIPGSTEIFIAWTFLIVTLILRIAGSRPPDATGWLGGIQWPVVAVSALAYSAVIYASGGQLGDHEPFKDQVLVFQVVAAAIGIVAPVLVPNLISPEKPKEPAKD